MMKAAVLHALGEAPSYEGFAEPTPNKDETLVGVRAASLKNSDKMMADGSHYDSLRRLPAVVGLDGVGVLEDGTRVYCAGPRSPYGTMAEKTVVPRAFCLPVPDAVDDLTAAALPNPAIASWLSLEWKAKLEPGETVLILGATGVAGRLAVQLARHLGAGRVIGAGRNAEALEALAGLGADATIRLEGSDDELEEAFADQARDGLRLGPRLSMGPPDGGTGCRPHGTRRDGRVQEDASDPDRRDGGTDHQTPGRCPAEFGLGGDG
jgi:NADPH:quinone reductase-like Zn-dependent oxidoreductase